MVGRRWLPMSSLVPAGQPCLSALSPSRAGTAATGRGAVTRRPVRCRACSVTTMPTRSLPVCPAHCVGSVATDVGVRPTPDAVGLAVGNVGAAVSLGALVLAASPSHVAGVAVASSILVAGMLSALSLVSAVRVIGDSLIVRTPWRRRCISSDRIEGIEERSVVAGPFRGWVLRLLLSDGSSITCWCTASSDRDHVARALRELQLLNERVDTRAR